MRHRGQTPRLPLREIAGSRGPYVTVNLDKTPRHAESLSDQPRIAWRSYQVMTISYQSLFYAAFRKQVGPKGPRSLT